MSNLTEFLLARIAEDEAVARDAIDSDRPGVHWRWTAFNDGPDAMLHLETVEQFPTQSGVGDLPAFPIGYDEVYETLAMPHIARHDPARVLAECQVKRRVIEQCERLENQSLDGAWWLTAQDDILAALAAVYSDHPDYNEEWRQ